MDVKLAFTDKEITPWTSLSPQAIIATQAKPNISLCEANVMRNLPNTWLAEYTNPKRAA